MLNLRPQIRPADAVVTATVRIYGIFNPAGRQGRHYIQGKECRLIGNHCVVKFPSFRQYLTQSHRAGIPALSRLWGSSWFQSQ